MGAIDIDIDQWTIEKAVTFTNFLLNTTLSTVCYDRVLAAWSAQTLAAGASTTTIHFGNSKYTNSEPTLTHRDDLLAMVSDIIDGGPA